MVVEVEPPEDQPFLLGVERLEPRRGPVHQRVPLDQPGGRPRRGPAVPFAGERAGPLPQHVEPRIHPVDDFLLGGDLQHSDIRHDPSICAVQPPEISIRDDSDGPAGGYN